ncbi:conserved hypothetical protein [Ricinus communis]|uniref:Uncharacterized protein n=1 Tax=Ricinus communis TaxID=3988 RepID=B9RNL2_RICCO|nr:conserved hypothetical protein [Ricinus communis]
MELEKFTPWSYYSWEGSEVAVHEFIDLPWVKWKKELGRECFQQNEADAILQTPLSKFRLNKRPIWQNQANSVPNGRII